MNKRNVFLSSLVLLFALSIASCGGSNPGSGSEAPVDEDPDGYVDVLPANNDGNILQAFCWTYNQIKENIPHIADAGFKVVQTSPVQEPKSGGSRWEFFYQPLSFSIATNSALGTKQELKELCDTAEQYGVSIICDIVFNHMANISDEDLESDGTPKVYQEVENYEPYIYQHRNDSGESATFHHNPNASGSGSVTQTYPYGGLPDLNTANPYVQERCLALLKECIDVGVDGFRFDAAKHIETPDDPQYASDFWPNTLGVAKTYYKQKTNQDLIAYGEILNETGGNRSLECYTKLMKVSDNGYITNIKSGSISNTGALRVVNATYGKSTAASNLVLWPESHDDYASTTAHMPESRLRRQYAVMASRKNAVTMFLARPATNVIEVGKVGSHQFEDLTYGAINRFHNRFVGYEEDQHAIDKTSIYYNERYNDTTVGAMVINFAGAAEKQELKFNHMGTGVYYNQVTGEAITVRNNKATVDFDSTGIIVLTKSKNLARPRVTTSSYGGSFVGTMQLTIGAVNASSAYYTINGGSRIELPASKTITIGDNVDANNKVTVVLHAENGTYVAERTYVFEKINLIPDHFNVVNINAKYLTDYDLYYWHWGTGKEGQWSNNYTMQDGALLIDFPSTSDSFLLAIMPKGHVIPNMNEWDNAVIKQTGDISIAAGFYNASDF